MSKTKISEYSETASNNTDIGGINIAEGMAPSDVNNAMREQMSQLKKFLDGSSGDTLTSAKIVATTAEVTGAATFGGAVIMSSDVTLRAQSDLRFADSDSSNWVAFQAPATVSSNVTWTLPAADGTTGQLLSTNGSGTLSWASGGGGGSSISAGDSKVEVTDSGTGKVEVTVDNVEVADFTTGAIVFNETGANQDFRVEGDTNANLIVADAGVDKVGIGTGTFNTNGGVLQVSNGISFPATQSACSDANTLDDYEEGTWTPIDSSGASLSFSSASGVYTKIGKLVVIQGTVTYPSTANGNNAKIGGMPFAPATGAVNRMGYLVRTEETTAKYCFPDETSTFTEVFDNTATRITNATLSGDSVAFVLTFQVS